MTAIIIRPFAYDSEAHSVSSKSGVITIENLSPQLSDGERDEQKKCIEEGLFDIFIKYTQQFDKNGHNEAAT